MTPVQVVAHNLENDNSPYSYRSAVVAEKENDVIGAALSFPSSYHKITDTMRNYFPADRIEHLRQFYASRIENSWLLDALCVIESHRRQGIGEKLISLTKEKAVENGCRTLSLITFADNDLAIPFYKRTGFEIVEKVELRGNDFIKHEGGCLLMNCEFIT
jgi:GNAT superfamily N-acetyltransferase